jgi:hypothetical protein
MSNKSCARVRDYVADVSLKCGVRAGRAARLGSVFLVLLSLTVALSPAISSNSSAASINPCQGKNLIGATASSSVYAGGGIIVLAITNIGPSACHLGGYPQLLGIRGGHEYKLTHVGKGPTQDGQLRATTLSPRESGALIFDTPLGCNANANPLPVATEFTGVVILLPDRQGHVKILGVPLSMPCGVSESRLGWAKGFELNQ